MNIALNLAVGLVFVAAAILAGMVIFGTAEAPSPLSSISKPFETADFSTLPPVQTLAARSDGTLAFRQWNSGSAGVPGTVVIAIHGSSASSASLHPLADALSAHGIEVYAPDIRGHGQSEPRGDIAHETQLDEDLNDLVAEIARRHPASRPVLIGFSSEGGYALHVAGSPLGLKFGRVLLISPMLGPFAPTIREGGNAWAKPFIPRIVALSILNRFGIRGFDYLPVIRFAIDPAQASFLTATYSFRLLKAFGTKDYAADLSHAAIPVQVLVGGEDELFDAGRFEPAIHAVRPDFPVTVVDGVNHIGMITAAPGIDAILKALKSQA